MGPRPSDFSRWASLVCEVCRSCATACRMCSAWLRNANDPMFAATGWRVAANATHCARIGSTFREISRST
jgi:hypothetical protein